jgi:hypothetical protein
MISAHYTATMITTIDGRQVLSDSHEWRRCCEAVHVLGMSHARRIGWLQDIAKRRGDAGLQALEDEMINLEPAFLLAFPDKESRRAYLGDVEKYRGPVAKELLEKRIVALWEERKAALAA